ncbi:UvrB/UvrC motif-containing protein [Clostridium sp. KNHs216]|uniref:UvrB/UvrC motif-containing protein n=1 Tax=Clostridium sp. KNHs216 TaxID=1550235 RepID=UPI0011512A81|nr:UvrB/UvrC motif-containing protein [Clostridium sp. KNHs216]TQI65988.1 protein arginine kinase activator [Clostridium sp. KNHs216]
MLCDSCGKNPVTTHIKTIINGELTEYSLCAECAQRLGYGNLLTGLGCDYGSLLGGFFGGAELDDPVRCKCCGATFDDIMRSGQVGCAQCYHTFYDRLIPLIQRIHGNTKHRGKVPGGGALQSRPQEQLSLMRRELREAIDAENFEHAASLRDRIKELEGGKARE